MTEFKREARYYVFKISKLDDETDQELFNLKQALGPHNDFECVVVESDWPNYEQTWRDIESASKGEFKDRQSINTIKAQAVRDAIPLIECALCAGDAIDILQERANKLERGEL